METIRALEARLIHAIKIPRRSEWAEAQLIPCDKKKSHRRTDIGSPFRPKLPLAPLGN